MNKKYRIKNRLNNFNKKNKIYLKYIKKNWYKI